MHKCRRSPSFFGRLTLLAFPVCPLSHCAESHSSSRRHSYSLNSRLRSLVPPPTAWRRSPAIFLPSPGFQGTYVIRGHFYNCPPVLLHVVQTARSAHSGGPSLHLPSTSLFRDVEQCGPASFPLSYSDHYFFSWPGGFMTWYHLSSSL